MNDIPLWIIGVVVSVVILSGITLKRWKYSILIGYILIILGETVLFRSAGQLRYELIPFWFYSNSKLYPQILANIILFIPFGLLSGALWDWRGIPAAAGLSLLVELMQLITHRGLFEFDDVIHNMAGAAIGCGILMLMRKAKDR